MAAISGGIESWRINEMANNNINVLADILYNNMSGRRKSAKMSKKCGGRKAIGEKESPRNKWQHERRKLNQWL
jgi:hypothetical protein